MNSSKIEQLKRLARIRIVLGNIKDELSAIQEDEPYVWPIDESNDIFNLFDRVDLILSQWSTQIQTRNFREEKVK